MAGDRDEDRPLTPALWRQRLSRLWPPFVLVTLLVGIIDMAGGHGFHPVHAVMFGSWHLWYIQAIGVILGAMLFLELWVSPSSRGLWIAAGIAALVAASGLLAGITLLSIQKAAYLMPHFLAGAALGSTPQEQPPRLLKVAIYTLGFVSLFTTQLSLNGYGHVWAEGSLVATSLGLAGFLLIGTMAPRSRALRTIGVHSLPIFLWHLPIYAVASFVLLHRFHVEPHVAVLLKIVAGLVGPIQLARFTERNVPRATLLIGARDPRRLLADQRRSADLEIDSQARLQQA